MTTKLIMKGLMDQLQMVPLSFVVTSSGDYETGVQSAYWISQSGDMQVMVVTRFRVDKLFFTTSVKLENKGQSTMTDVYCKFFYFVISLLTIHFFCVYRYAYDGSRSRATLDEYVYY